MSLQAKLHNQTDQTCSDIIQRALAEPSDTEYALKLIQIVGINSFSSQEHLPVITKSMDKHVTQQSTYKLVQKTVNRAKYIIFQIRHRKMTNYTDCIHQAEIAVADKNAEYAELFLHKALQLIKKKPFNLSAELNLVFAVNTLLDNEDWLTSLLDDCAEQIQDMPQICQLGESLIQSLQNKDYAISWVRNLYQNWQDHLVNTAAPSHMFERLAWAVWQQLQDQTWATQLLEIAHAKANTPLELASLGYTARCWDVHAKAENYYREAANQCAESQQLIQLFQHLQAYKEPDGLLGYLYQHTERRHVNAIDKLRWADDIVQAFADEEWAIDIYHNLRATLANEQM